ncbi:hypothetical protein ACF0H5_004605 [Mactra antiquata]
MKIPMKQVEVKTFTIPGGQRSKIEDHLFQGQLPTRLILGMVRNGDMNMSLYQATDSLGLDRSMGISLNDYRNGYPLWGVDLTADQGAEEGQLYPIRTGNFA